MLSRLHHFCSKNAEINDFFSLKILWLSEPNRSLITYWFWINVDSPKEILPDSGLNLGWITTGWV